LPLEMAPSTFWYNIPFSTKKRHNNIKHTTASP
jgi:hypothetical protein